MQDPIGLEWRCSKHNSSSIFKPGTPIVNPFPVKMDTCGPSPVLSKNLLVSIGNVPACTQKLKDGPML